MEALDALHEGACVGYVPGAPGCVNEPFTQRYPDGLPPLAWYGERR